MDKLLAAINLAKDLRRINVNSDMAAEIAAKDKGVEKGILLVALRHMRG